VFSLLKCAYGSYGRDNLAPPSSFSVPVAAQEILLELVFQTSVTGFRSDGWQTGIGPMKNLARMTKFLENGVIGKLPNLDLQLWEVTENATFQEVVLWLI